MAFGAGHWQLCPCNWRRCRWSRCIPSSRPHFRVDQRLPYTKETTMTTNTFCASCGRMSTSEGAESLGCRYYCISCADFFQELKRKKPLRSMRAWLSRKAATMRNSPTKGERAMWNALKGIDGWHSQVVISAFIVDFLHAPTSTIVEIDGGYHLEPAQVVNDAARSRELSRRGYTVIRFSNGEVTNGIEAVMERLAAITCHRTKVATTAPLQRLPPPPNVRANKEPAGVKRWNGRQYVMTKGKPDVRLARVPLRGGCR